MIDTSKWKEYRMSGPEREYLDAYLANLKKNTDPDLGDDVFFADFVLLKSLSPEIWMSTNWPTVTRMVASMAVLTLFTSSWQANS